MMKKKLKHTIMISWLGKPERYKMLQINPSCRYHNHKIERHSNVVNQIGAEF